MQGGYISKTNNGAYLLKLNTNEHEHAQSLSRVQLFHPRLLCPPLFPRVCSRTYHPTPKLEWYHLSGAPQPNPIPLYPLFRGNHCAESLIIPLLLKNNSATCTNQYTAFLLNLHRHCLIMYLVFRNLIFSFSIIFLRSTHV